MTLSPSYSLGLFFILLVSLVWAAASILVQWVYSSDEFDFHSPFLLTYIGVSLFTCFLPANWITMYFWGGASAHSMATVEEYESIPPPAETTTITIPTTAGAIIRPSPLLWTTRDHLWAAAKIAPVWFISNYAYNASLEFTSITSSTVLASTGSLFTFLFAILVRDERFSFLKVMGILLGMTGSVLTGLHDIQSNSGSSPSDENNNSNNVLWGDYLGLISAAGYGVYATMVRVLCPRDESLMSMQLFLGFVGLWNMVILSPIAIYLTVFKGTVLTGFLFGCLVIKGLFDNVLSDYLWARAVVLTSATVATVGLGLTIPLAFATDVVMGRPNVLDVTSVVGAFAVLAGFVLVNLGQQKENEEFSDRAVGAALDAGALVPDPTDTAEQQYHGVLESQAHCRTPMHMDEYHDQPMVT
jgi:solute carrier family 35, member F5